jgi:hypothetical protein
MHGPTVIPANLDVNDTQPAGKRTEKKKKKNYAGSENHAPHQ